MNAFRLASAAALIFVVVGSTCPIQAQPTQSEIDISHDLKQLPFPGGDSEKALLERLRNHQFSNMADTMRNHGMLDGKSMDYFKQHPDEMLELLRKNGLKPEAIEAIKKNPALLQMAYDRIERGDGLPEGAAMPSNQLNSALKELGTPPNAQAAPAQSQPEATAPAAETGSLGQTSKPRQPALDEAAAPKPEQSMPESTNEGEAPRSGLGQKLQGWAERLQSLNPQWRNSPAFQRAVQSLAKTVGREDPKWQKLSEAGDHLRERFSEWSKSTGLEHFWASRRFQFPDAPALDGMNKFTRAVAENTPSNFNMPQIGSPQSGGGTLALFAWLVGLVAAAVGLRQLWLFLQAKNAEHQRKQALMRAWPVDPSSVHSREALIRAYEYLALSRLGIAAKSWNHLAIATSLGNTTDPLRRNAAFSLTNAYEQARYAPVEEAMPKEVLVEARQQLCLLAGVKGA
jgi:hypothetical protein